MFDAVAYEERLEETVAFLRPLLQPCPAVGIIAGTGLGGVVNDSEMSGRWHYEEIPYFPVSTVPGHSGRLLLGDVAGRSIAVLQGRFHLYEGYAAHEIAFPIRVLARCGVKALIITNAAGGLDLGFERADLMLITDHINMTGDNPLIGPHNETWGDRFPDMSRVYDVELQDVARRCAATAGLTLREGVYVCVKGPSLETRAETRFLRAMGADAVGMSTVTEAIVGLQAGMRICGISAITNVNDPANMESVSHNAVVEAANIAAPPLRTADPGHARGLALWTFDIRRTRDARRCLRWLPAIRSRVSGSGTTFRLGPDPRPYRRDLRNRY